MPELTRLEREGRYLLNIRYHRDGRWGGHVPDWRQQGGWLVAKYRPKPGETLWARTSHPRHRKLIHAVRYTLQATHEKTGKVMWMTVWMCGQRASSPIEIVEDPGRVHGSCRQRLSGATEVRP